MRRATAGLLSNFSFYTRNLLLSSPKLNPKPNPLLPPLAATTTTSAPIFGIRFCSSESKPPKETSFDHTQNSNGSTDAVAAPNREELKKQIERYYQGDEEAIPDIFESILKRKLAGINDDHDLIEELEQKFPREDLEGQEYDFDSFDDTDEEEVK